MSARRPGRALGALAAALLTLAGVAAPTWAGEPAAPIAAHAASAGVVPVATTQTLVVTASALNVRSGPSTAYARIGTVYSGQSFAVTGTSDGWHRIGWNGREAWVSGNWVTVSSVSSPTGTGTVTATVLNVRTGPSTSYAIIGRALAGQPYPVLGSSGGWYRIQFGTREAWVSGDHLRVTASAPAPSGPTATTTSPRYVTTRLLNVRSGPSTADAVVGRVMLGARLEVTGSSNGWYRVTHSGGSGWVSGSYTTVYPAGGPSAAWPADRPLSYSGTADSRNGRIDGEQCAIPFLPGHRIHCRTVGDLVLLNTAYRARFGTDLPIDPWRYSTYRTYDDQVIVLREFGSSVAAQVGTSPHGWGQAIDFREGDAYDFGSPIHDWLRTNGPTHGWKLMPWHEEAGSWPEYWHFDYVR